MGESDEIIIIVNNIFHVFDVSKWEAWGWASKATSLKLIMCLDWGNPPCICYYQDQ
ncbi:uncharacterized protein DS421_9g276820 [Arachis hypogaea]|nr:uncharacterized protein DS421_9g276820 [Arachis hypogaea]